MDGVFARGSDEEVVHAQVFVREGERELARRRQHFADDAGFLLQLTQGRLLQSLAGVDVALGEDPVADALTGPD